MQQLFSSLIEFYRKAEGSYHSSALNYHINNDDDIALIRTLTSDQNYEDTGVDLKDDESSLVVGQSVQLNIKIPDVNFGRLYKKFQDFLKGDLHRNLLSSNSNFIPYYIEDMDYSSTDSELPDDIISYNAIKDLLRCLTRMSVYLDTSIKKAIFVGKSTFELSYDISADPASFEKAIESFSKNLSKNLEVSKKFCGWLDVNDANRHSNERKAILSSVLSDIQTGSKQLDISDVVENVERIYIAAQGQLDNYLEDFKYEKFVQKLEENSEKFISRVNDSISKVLSQILALPIAAAAPVILKGGSSNSQVIIYIALLVYAIICSFALSTQKAVLDNLSSEVKGFETQGKLPQSLKDRWIIEKAKICDLIEKQTHLYWVMIFVVYTVILYSVIRILCSL